MRAFTCGARPQARDGLHGRRYQFSGLEGLRVSRSLASLSA